MKSIHKALSIQVNLNGLSFCILNKTNNSVEHLHEVEFNKPCTPHEILPCIKEELSSRTVFTEDFSEVVVIHQNELTTLVPSELFDESNSADYLKYNSKILKSDYISHDDIEIMDLKNVYVPYVNVNNYIFDTFGQFTYKHSLTVFSDAILRNPFKNKGSFLVFLNINNNSFEVIVTKAGQIILTNVHRYYSNEDFIYFVLFTLDQLDLDPNDQEIILSGKIEKGDQLFEILYTYVRHISFNSHSKEIKLGSEFLTNSYRHFLILNSF